MVTALLWTVCPPAWTQVPVDSNSVPINSGIVVEEMPAFPGGQKALFQFLSQNVHYPEEAFRNGIQGRVVCQFIVNKDGSVSDVEVVRSGGHELLDNEAVRVISMMPTWKPGMQEGQPIRVRYTIPVTFRLPRDSKQESTPDPANVSQPNEPRQEELAVQKDAVWQGDKCFEQSQYGKAMTAYQQAISERGLTAELSQKIEAASVCNTLYTNAISAEQTATPELCENYQNAALMYQQLYSYHPLPYYREKAEQLETKSRYFLALRYLGEGDDLFSKAQYDQAAQKYQAAGRLWEDAALREKAEKAVTCSNLLREARMLELDAAEENRPSQYEGALKLYTLLYSMSPQLQYKKKIDELEKHVPRKPVKDEQPQFPGGKKALEDYLSKQMTVPTPISEYEKDSVICLFAIDEQGRVCDIEFRLASRNDSINQEAVRILQSMPRWQPGTRNGKPARFHFSAPPFIFWVKIPDYVDLGLPSGTLWATRNVGAKTPAENGYHFQWGCLQTEWSTGEQPYCFGTVDKPVKYCTDSAFSFVDNKIILEPEDDAATQLMGPDWRMPTQDEMRELWKLCTRVPEKVATKWGCRFIGPNGKSIFLPYNGWIDGWGKPQENNDKGLYWTSSLDNLNNRSAWGLIVGGNQKNGVLAGKANRAYTRGVRPVRARKK